MAELKKLPQEILLYCDNIYLAATKIIVKKALRKNIANVI